MDKGGVSLLTSSSNTTNTTIGGDEGRGDTTASPGTTGNLMFFSPSIFVILSILQFQKSRVQKSMKDAPNLGSGLFYTKKCWTYEY